MKILLISMLTLFFISATQAAHIDMFGQEKYGFSQPRYQEPNWDTLKQMEGDGTIILEAVAADKHFPFSSQKQGSVFTKIFELTSDKTKVYISIYCDKKNYENVVTEFERGSTESPNALFGVYYEEIPYSQNQLLYPAFFTNNVHIIYSNQKRLNISNKSDLKNYKGVHVSTDRVSSTVAKEFKSLSIKEVKNFSQAFEELLTGKADYMVAGYYPSLIELYKLGIKDYVVYSKNPIWKMPMFIKVDPKIKKDARIQEFEKYLRSWAYIEKREKTLEELVKIYEDNTRGIVSPTYINTTTNKEEQEHAE